MSDAITLSLRAPLEVRLEVERLTGDHLAGLSEGDIAALPVWMGNRSVPLGEFFDVKGERSSSVRIEGDVSRLDGLGAGMSAGELVVAGDAGSYVAAGMTGGVVEVLGHVGNDAGVAMSGGTLRIQGNAGDRLAAARPGASRGMTGGEVIVRGSAGAEVAARCRRGLVAVAGDVGDHAGRSMIAGTLIVLGATGPEAGRGNKRGSIVAVGPITVPQTYRYACTYEPTYVRLVMTRLERTYGLEASGLEGRYRRFCGDAGEPGKGEILQHV